MDHPTDARAPWQRNEDHALSRIEGLKDLVDSLDTILGDLVLKVAASVMAELDSEVDRLRRSLANELTTRRLVVVDERGFPRVVAATLPGSGSLTVHGFGHHGSDPLEVSLVAA